MSKQPKFLNRIEVISAALSIVRQNGIQALNARALVKKLNSTAPVVFYELKNMDEVLQAVREAAREIYTHYLQEGLENHSKYNGVARQYIRFAINDPHVFALLWMQEEKKQLPTASGMLYLMEENYDQIIEYACKLYGLCESGALKLYTDMWLYAHGIASMCATGLCYFEEEEIDRMLESACRAFLGQIHADEAADKKAEPEKA